MSALLNNSLWYRVAKLRPMLRQYVDIHRHVYRGEVWYLIQDPASGRQHRFCSRAQAIIGRMDGTRTLQQIWDEIDTEKSGHDLSQDDMIGLLAQLHAADLLNVQIMPDTEELLRRGQASKSKRLKGRFTNPLSIRLPLLDPERFLKRTLPAVRWLLGPLGLIIWLGVVVGAVVMASMSWPELTSNVSDRILAPTNLFLIWLIYPFVKGLHELGHSYAAIRWGGEVHEMGIMLLVFTPVPYVDASCSSAFPDKKHRMLVAAAGIIVEILVAALAMFVWSAAEPGLVRAIAFNIMLIGAASTIIINGNPLLRYDGYYVLADLLEIPNLAARSKQFIGYLVRRYVFGFESAQSPASAPGEDILVTGLCPGLIHVPDVHHVHDHPVRRREIFYCRYTDCFVGSYDPDDLASRKMGTSNNSKC